jgi:large subunit ribosomal protein L33
MSQDNLIKLECTQCKKVNYHSSKNKKTIKARLEIMKFCGSACRKRTMHKETK